MPPPLRTCTLKWLTASVQRRAARRHVDMCKWICASGFIQSVACRPASAFFFFFFMSCRRVASPRPRVDGSTVYIQQSERVVLRMLALPSARRS